MGYSEGMAAFKAGEYERAAHEFLAVTEQNDQHDKAWNALGICLSKLGDFEQARLSFENACSLKPENETYKKNFERNEAKRQADPALELDDEPVPVKPVGPVKKPAAVQYTPVQMAIGVAALFIVLMFMGACVTSLGGGGSKQPAVVQTVGTSAPVQAIETPAPTPTQTQDTTTIGEKNALKKAKNYLSFMAFSRGGLIHQLEYDKFTTAEAEYGADNVGADWNEQAAKKAKRYLETMSFSRDGLIKQLEYDKFTPEQAAYGASAAGY